MARIAGRRRLRRQPIGSPELLDALAAFFEADTWNESWSIVEQCPVLLTDEADLALRQLIAVADGEGDEQQLQWLIDHWELLQRCRTAGTAQAFAEKLGLVNAAAEPPQVQLDRLVRDIQALPVPQGAPRRVPILMRTRGGAPEQTPRAAMLQLHLNLALRLLQDAAGDRAENVEWAIACCETALETQAGEVSRRDWAMAHACLGAALLERIRGDTADNMEQAIACNERALQVWTEADDPRVWADLQNNLGKALQQRIRGDRAENVERAIACHQAALRVRRQLTDAKGVGHSLTNLAGALCLRFKGDPADNFDRAIACLEEALACFSAPAELARVQANLGTALFRRIRGDRAENLERAIASYQAGLRGFDQGGDQREAAQALTSLADVLSERVHGNRAENVEQAIAYCEAALEIFTLESFPEDWAAAQLNLGRAYSKWVEGNKAENLERAITCYQAALAVYTRGSLPELWARTIVNLAADLINRAHGDKRDNIERAIRCLQGALEVYTKQADPVNWALVQYNFGNAMLNRIAGDHADNLERAIACYEAALEVDTEAALPYRWAQDQRALGTAFARRVRGGRRDNRRRAIACQEAALRVLDQSTSPLDWAAVQEGLGEALLLIPEDRVTDFDRAISHFQAALGVVTRESDPVHWAELTVRLGDAHQDRLQRDGAESSNVAISAYTAALEVFTRERLPRHLANAQTQLGEALAARAQAGINSAENLEQAITCYEAALTVRTREALPLEWAMTQSALGSAYRHRLVGDPAGNLEQAIEHFEAALEVLTREGTPQSWAATTVNLADAYRSRVRGDRAANMEHALDLVRAAMHVNAVASDPYVQALNRSSLGAIYAGRRFGDRIDNLYQAITCYKHALAVLAKETTPADWALVQSNLGNAYMALATHGRDSSGNIEQAIARYAAALEVRTPEKLPFQWANTQHHLGVALSLRPDGDVTENLTRAIGHLQKALSVLDRETLPLRWASSQTQLGAVYQARRLEGDLEEAVGCYKAALEVFRAIGSLVQIRDTAAALAKAYEDLRRWGPACQSYETALDAVDLLYAASFSREAKELELGEARGVHLAAASTMFHAGRMRDAAVMLERGRARLLGDALARDRADLDELLRRDRAAHDAYQRAVRLVREVESLELARRSHAEPMDEGGPSQGQAGATAEEQRRQLANTAAAALSRAIDGIRAVPGFERFLHPPEFSDIDAAVEVGTPLVYLTMHMPIGALTLLLRRSRADAEVDIHAALGLGTWELARALGLDPFGNRRDPSSMTTTPPASARDEVLSLIGRSVAQAIGAVLTLNGDRSVTLIPCGALAGIAIHAAPWDEAGEPVRLLDRFDVAYAPSARTLHRARATLASLSGRRPALTAVGASPPDGQEWSLSLATFEEARIAACFEAVHFLKGDQTTISSLAAAASEATHIHFSCHGTFTVDEPLRSYLLLGPQSRLTLGELLGWMSLAGVRLIVAAACESATTDQARIPDEAIGFPAAFLQAGASGVVGTLWKASAISSALLVPRFYKYHLVGIPELGLGPLSPARALRFAQRWLAELTAGETLNLLERSGEPVLGKLSDMVAELPPSARPFADPHHWAVFTFVGA